MKVAFAFALLGGVVACAPIPPPDVLRDAELTAVSPAVLLASKVAPVARAHADTLVRDAQRALREGDFAGAQLLGEQAKAAYEVLVAEARLVRAEEQRQRETAAVDGQSKELAALDAENQRIAADIAALEQRLEARTLETGTSPNVADERARVLAQARFEARILCTAAEVLGGPSVTEAASKKLAALDKIQPSDIDRRVLAEARAAVEACRAALAAARGDGNSSGPAAGGPDEATLESDLARRGFDVLRDERGVVVRLFAGNGGTKAAVATSPQRDALLAVAQKALRPIVLVVRGVPSSVSSAAGADAISALLKPVLSRPLAEGQTLEVVFVSNRSF